MTIHNLARKTAAIALACILPMTSSAMDSDDAADYVETPLTESDRDHWSLRPLTRPAVPDVRDVEWAITPVDRFVLAGLEAVALHPRRAADRATLLRRLTFDLLGLPPTPDELDAFTTDDAPDAYERLVERLLASPRHGERWGQHWLDLARFAETDGFEHDLVRAEAWRYRDWVIQALNHDLPYDQFVQMQLAGDELRPGDADAARATGFCYAGPDMPDVNSQEERRQRLLTEIASTVGSVFLGLQVGCAECHDHKYDPVSQADFYRLRAIFAPAVVVKKNQSLDVLSEPATPPTASHLLLRGDWQRPGPVVQPAFLRAANLHNEPFQPTASTSSSGRRAALANWLTQADHPLTSRVIVNRIWQHHFGEGLSNTPSDFGVLGDEPLYGELLDWLATELVASDWSLKSLHRLLVNSAVYRQASRGEDWNAVADSIDDGANSPAADTPRSSQVLRREVRLLARFPRRRLEGEVIRDAMLACAGSLGSEQGGAGVRPPLPQELLSTLLKNQWQVSPREADHYRRSVYVFARRNLRYPIFDVFDRPDANASCAARGRSTTAPQALLMMNSELALNLASQFAARLRRETSEPQDQIRRAFVIALARLPSELELRESGELVTADDSDTGLIALCLALFNTNEFQYTD